MTAVRPLLFAAAAAALIGGMTAGLQRLGWEIALPDALAELSAVHGPLMVCGFFGTVVALERAVALGKPWAYGAPAFTGAGTIALAFLPSAVPALMLAGSVAFLIGTLVVVRRQPALYTVAMALGGAAWVFGTATWLIGGEVSAAVAAWANFLILTIAGERLELSRFMPPSRWKGPTAAITFLVLLGGAWLLAVGASAGATLFGLGLLALAAWLVRHDIVRRTIRQKGLTRFMAVALGSGYVWLAAGGAFCLVFGLPQGGPIYDAVLHSLFVGFVFAMVFGHMPVILPSLFKIALPFTNIFYLPLLLLHASLTLRVVGDLADWDEVRRWGGLLNVTAILVFLAVTALSVWRGRRLDTKPSQR